MCNPDTDYPPYDEPIEDSIDWAELRHRKLRRYASEDERAFGIPVREGVIRREADRLHHSQARRGFEYHE